MDTKYVPLSNNQSENTSTPTYTIKVLSPSNQLSTLHTSHDSFTVGSSFKADLKIQLPSVQKEHLLFDLKNKQFVVNDDFVVVYRQANENGQDNAEMNSVESNQEIVDPFHPNNPLNEQKANTPTDGSNNDLEIKEFFKNNKKESERVSKGLFEFGDIFDVRGTRIKIMPYENEMKQEPATMKDTGVETRNNSQTQSYDNKEFQSEDTSASNTCTTDAYILKSDLAMKQAREISEKEERESKVETISNSVSDTSSVDNEPITAHHQENDKYPIDQDMDNKPGYDTLRNLNDMSQDDVDQTTTEKAFIVEEEVVQVRNVEIEYPVSNYEIENRVKDEIIMEVGRDIKEQVIENVTVDMENEIRREGVVEMVCEKMSGMADGMVDEVREDVVNIAKEEVKDEIKDEIRESIKRGVGEEIKHEIEEEIKQELRDGIKQEIKEDLQDIKMDIKKENDEFKENISALEHKIEENVEKDLQDVIKEEIEEEVVEKVRNEGVKMMIKEKVEELNSGDIKEKVEEINSGDIKEKVEEINSGDIKEPVKEEQEVPAEGVNTPKKKQFSRKTKVREESEESDNEKDQESDKNEETNKSKQEKGKTGKSKSISEKKKETVKEEKEDAKRKKGNKKVGKKEEQESDEKELDPKSKTAKKPSKVKKDETLEEPLNEKPPAEKKQSFKSKKEPEIVEEPPVKKQSLKSKKEPEIVEEPPVKKQSLKSKKVPVKNKQEKPKKQSIKKEEEDEDEATFSDISSSEDTTDSLGVAPKRVSIKNKKPSVSPKRVKKESIVRKKQPAKKKGPVKKTKRTRR